MPSSYLTDSSESESESTAAAQKNSDKKSNQRKKVNEWRPREEKEWKPAKFQSYETIQLVATKNNSTVRPAGFSLPYGNFRKIKNSCLLSRIRNLSILADHRPRLCVCITMYNEDEELFKATLKGIIQNYNVMSMAENFKASDMVVCLICDGFNGIPERMKDYLRKHRLFDERTLKEKGFMEEKDNEEGKKKFKMKAIKNCMEE